MARVNSTGKESSSNFSPANGTGSAVRTAMKDIFESIRTFNSASGDPSGTANLAAFQPHIDSDTNLLKIRNAANSAFITLGNVSEANFGHLDLSGGTLTGVLGLPNATASAPSVHFGDSSTGLFRRGSNQIGFTFSGTERAFIDQNGLSLLGTKAARFFDSDDSHYVEIKAGTVTANRTITLPDDTGTLMTTASSLFTLGTTSVTSGGTIQAVSGIHSIVPASNNAHDLGSNTLRWANLFVNDFNLSNEGHKNDVDGTWGSYTIQEGEESLFLINRRNGKKFKFVLEEVT
tara:strand:+ start:35 stop:904 length:870 start_codon:yes stop_codon:yes gene_type:complete